LADVPDGVDPARVHVRPQELDPMDHVNNAVYADWVDERILGLGGEPDVRAIPRTVRLEYARAVEPGSTILAEAWRDEGGWSCLLRDAAGAAYLRARLEPDEVNSP
jgi:acyl-ACP thioesterase